MTFKDKWKERLNTKTDKETTTSVNSEYKNKWKEAFENREYEKESASWSDSERFANKWKNGNALNRIAERTINSMGKAHGTTTTETDEDRQAREDALKMLQNGRQTVSATTDKDLVDARNNFLLGQNSIIGDGSAINPSTMEDDESKKKAEAININNAATTINAIKKVDEQVEADAKEREAKDNEFRNLSRIATNLSDEAKTKLNNENLADLGDNDEIRALLSDWVVNGSEDAYAKLKEQNNSVVSEDYWLTGYKNDVEAFAKENNISTEDAMTIMSGWNYYNDEADRRRFQGYSTIFPNADDWEEKSSYDGNEANRVGYFGEYLQNAPKREDYASATDYYRDYSKWQSDKNVFLGIESGWNAYEQMTDDEIAMYNYIFNTNGKEDADKYLDTLELTKRQSGVISDYSSELAEAHPFMGGLLSVAEGGLGGLALAQNMVSPFVTGENFDEYQGLNAMTHSRNAIRSTQLANIEDSIQNSDKAQWIKDAETKGATFLYNTGMSTAENLYQIAMSGGNSYISLALMGTSAAQSTTIEQLESGKSHLDAATMGILAGAIEVATEKIPIDNLFSMMKDMGSVNLKQSVKSVLKQGFVEGSEEVASEWLDEIADIVVNADKSELWSAYQNYLAEGMDEHQAFGKALLDRVGEKTLASVESFLSGAISGMAMGSPTVVAGGMNTHNINKASKSVDTTGNMSKLYDVAKNSEEGSKVRELAESVAENQMDKQMARKIINAGVEEGNDAVIDIANASNSLKQMSDNSSKDTRKKPGIVVSENVGVSLDSIGTLTENKNGTYSFTTENGEKKNSSSVAFKDVNTAQAFAKAYSFNNVAKANNYISALKMSPKMTSNTFSTMYDRIVSWITNGVKDTKSIDDFFTQTLNKMGMTKDSYDLIKTYAMGVKESNDNQYVAKGVPIIEALSQVVGTNVEFGGSEFKSGGKSENANGYYTFKRNADGNLEMSTIRLSDNTNQPLVTTFAHEFVHNTRQTDAESYESLASDIVGWLKEFNEDDYNRIYNDVQKLYADDVARWTKEGVSEAEIRSNLEEEIVARGTEAIIEKLAEMDDTEFAKQVNAHKSFFEKLIAKVKEFLKAFREHIKGYKATSEEAKILLKDAEHMQVLVDKYLDVLEKFSEEKTNEGTFSDLSDGDVSVNEFGDSATNNSIRMSVKTYDNGGKSRLIEWLDKYSGLDKKDKDDIINHVEDAYKVCKEFSENKDEYADFSEWADTDLMYIDGKPILRVVVNNGEYPLNIDFSTICKKRKTLNKVLNALVKDGFLDNRILTKENINTINSLIKQHRFEIACACCFVDTKRYRQGEWAESFTTNKTNTGFNDLVKSLVPKGSNITIDEFNFTNRKTPEPGGVLLKDVDDSELDFSYLNKVMGKYGTSTEAYRFANAIMHHKNLRSLVNPSDLMASDGFDAIRNENNELYELVNSHQGSAKPKLSFSEYPYGNDILLSDKFNPKDAYSVGGVRIQSFSDYMANMFFDYMQMFGDLAAKELPAHAYTKEDTFATLFGLNGTKINMSLVPKGASLTQEQEARFNKMSKTAKNKDAEFIKLKSHAGLDENGNYIIGDETFPFERAMKIRRMEGYDKNVGTIMIGVSDAHIWKLLEDENIDMIIPYHASSINPVIARLRNIDFYNDYTKQQNTRYGNSFAGKGRKVPLKYVKFDFYSDLAETNDPRKTAENYVKYCESEGYLPKFDKFAYLSDGTFNPNYYKLLVDFRVYDGNGNYAPQKAVTTKLPKDFASIVSKSLKVAQKTADNFNKEQKELLDEIKEAIVNPKDSKASETKAKAEPKAETKHSLKNSDGDTLTEDQANFFKDSKVRNEDGELLVVHHGTVREFYTFDREYSNAESNVGSGFYFTNNEEDVNTNYANRNGADFTQKVEREAEYILSEIGYEPDEYAEYLGLNYGEIVEKLKDHYATSKDPIVMDAYLDIKNPVYIGNYNGNRNTILFEDILGNINADDYEDEDDYYAAFDELAEETISNVVDYVMDNIQYEIIDDRAAETISNYLYGVVDDDGLDFEALRNGLNAEDLEDENGILLGNEIARLIAEALGYDGIIDNTVPQKFRGMHLDKDTVHFIAFNPNQIKSITNEHPTSNPDIRYSRKAEDKDIDFEDVYAMAEDRRVERVLENTLKEYNAKVNETEINNALADAYRLRDEDAMHEKLIHDVAMPIVKNAMDIVPATNKDVVNYLKNVKIKLNNSQIEEIKSAYGSIKEYRNALMRQGIMTISTKDGTDLNGLWDEIVAKSGNASELRETISDAEQPIALAKWLEEYGKSEMPAFTDSDYNEASQMLADEIMVKLMNIKKMRITETTVSDIIGKELKKGYYPISDDAIHSIAYSLVKENQSTYNVDDLTKDLKGVFTYLQTTNGKLNYKDFVRLTYDLAKPIIEASNVKGNKPERAFNTALKVYQLYFAHVGKSKTAKAVEEATKRVAERYENKIERIQTRKEITDLRKKIRTKKDRLDRMLLHPTKHSNVPTELVSIAVDIASAIDTRMRKRVSWRTEDKLAKLTEEYQRLLDRNQANATYDKAFVDVINRLRKATFGKNIGELTKDELELVDNVLNGILTQVSNQNKLVSQNRAESLSDIAIKGVDELMSQKGVSENNVVSRMWNAYQSLALNFERMLNLAFGYQKDSVGNQLTEIMESGEIKYLKTIQSGEAIFDDVLGGKNRKNLFDLQGKKNSGRSVDTSTWVTLPDSNLKVTKDMRLSLIMHLRNTDNLRHIAYGGFKVPNVADLKHGRQYAYDRGETFIPDFITQDDIVEAKKRLDALETYNEESGFAEPNRSNPLYREYERAIRNRNAQGNPHAREELDAVVTEKWNAYQEELRKAHNYLDSVLKERGEAYARKLESELSDYEVKWLNDLRRFFYDFSGAEINKVTRNLYGYDKAIVDKYYPISVDRDALVLESESVKMDGTIEGMGMLKERVSSKKPIYLLGASDVAEKHIQQTAKFVGWAEALRDAKGILNFKIDSNKSVNWAIKMKRFGIADQIQNVINDIENPSKGNSINRVFNKLRSNFAGATLTGNLQVTLKQAASFPTAIAEVGFNPVIKAFKHFGKSAMGKGIAEIESRTPLLKYRENANEFSYEAGAMGSDKLKWFTGMISWMDVATVRTLEYASKYAVDDYLAQNNIELDEDSYWDMVTDKFNDVIRRTQPNYSTLERPELLRNDNAMLRTLFMFKTQPMQNYGLMFDAISEYVIKARNEKQNPTEEAKAERVEAGKKMARTITSNILSAMVFSAMSVFAKVFFRNPGDWWEDEDEDGKKEMQWDAMFKTFITSILSSEAGMFLGGQEIYEYLASKATGDKYWGMSDSVVDMFNDLTTSIDGVSKAFANFGDAVTEADKEKYGKVLTYKIQALATNLAAMFGLPINNAYKILNSYIGLGLAMDIVNGEWFSGGLIDNDTSDIASQNERIVKAWSENNIDRYEMLREQSIRNKVSDDTTYEDASKSVDSSIKKAMKQAYKNGEITEAELTDYLVETASENNDDDVTTEYTTDDAWFDIQAIDGSTYQNLFDIIDSYAGGEIVNISTFIATSKEYLEHGKDKSSIASSITNHYKQSYLSASGNTKTRLRMALINAFVSIGYTNADATKKVDGWSK